eukprot:CAMPEP_0170840496 /NCGR_PEP_ID=MMETSP0734-20130129/4611_1 /TAXON_ID=186038 /ORGANISM="Fragilariopsis kerguelensis, Strain L26-C5" /LENGTH=138 /DNA_ID=CAMNT_0011208313 /DNA_START=447 /DNA_END=860 /DNA_ORIENTATION=-
MVLLDRKRQAELKRNIQKDFPWVPHSVVDICLDSVADAFTNVAPSELKAALKPGGLEKARPRLEKSITNQLTSIINSNSLGDIPLIGSKEKKQLLQYLVSLSLDVLLQEAEQVLAEPSVKLRDLDAQRQEIQKYMTVW